MQTERGRRQSGSVARGSEVGWTPARLFLLAGGTWLLVLGLVGFAVSSSFPIGAAEAETAHSGHIFGIFETNGWHNLATVLIAAVSLPVAVLRPGWSRPVALAIGVIHVAVTAALFIWEPSTFWIASNSADQVVHATYAALGIGSGAATRVPNGAAVRPSRCIPAK